MYPKNAASPPQIALGAVVQISDGAVQTTGISIAVSEAGAAEAAGDNAATVGASSSAVYYTPSQTETNNTYFTVTAYKAGCIPVSQTIVTTDTATPGRVAISGTKDTLDDLQDIAATAIVSGGAIATTAGAVDNVTLVATTTTNTDMVSEPPTVAQNADYLLDRDMSLVSDTNARSPLNALRFLRNKWSVTGTTLTVTKENDTDPAWTATVTTDATAEPITGNDPA